MTGNSEHLEPNQTFLPLTYQSFAEGLHSIRSIGRAWLVNQPDASADGGLLLYQLQPQMPAGLQPPLMSVMKLQCAAAPALVLWSLITICSNCLHHPLSKLDMPKICFMLDILCMIGIAMQASQTSWHQYGEAPA